MDLENSIINNSALESTPPLPSMSKVSNISDNKLTLSTNSELSNFMNLDTFDESNVAVNIQPEKLLKNKIMTQNGETLSNRTSCQSVVNNRMEEHSSVLLSDPEVTIDSKETLNPVVTSPLHNSESSDSLVNSVLNSSVTSISDDKNNENPIIVDLNDDLLSQSSNISKSFSKSSVLNGGSSCFNNISSSVSPLSCDTVDSSSVGTVSSSVSTTSSSIASSPCSTASVSSSVTPPLSSDVKVIYINKNDGENKTTVPIPITNGVGGKMVQLGGSAGGSTGRAYFGTIIKSGKEGTAEGQKVLLTPVLKDGSRFILPRPNTVIPGPRAKVSTNMQPPSQIIISSPNQPRRSFLIHNSALNSKEIKSLGANAIVPKVLPPATKVPIVVTSSRSHPDVTLTSVKPHPTHNHDNANTSSYTSHESDEVELVSEGDMPRPISSKPLIMKSSKHIGIVGPSVLPGHKVINLNEEVPKENCDVSKQNSNEVSKQNSYDVSNDTVEVEETDDNKNNDAKDNSELMTEAKKIKLVSSNGHFVRILSSSNNINSESNSSLSTGDEGKNVIIKDNKSLLHKNHDDSHVSDRPTDQIRNNVMVTKQIQRSYPLKISSSGLSQLNESISSAPDVSPCKTSPSSTAVLSIPSNVGLTVKELCKEGVMMERSRKRKGAPLLRDCFKKTIAVKRLEPLNSANSYDPFKVIDWDQNTCIGNLPGSDVKFIVNSWGAIQVYEGETNNKNPNNNNNNNENNKSLSGMEVVYCAGDNSGKDEIGRCIECECYGLLIEFIEEKYCSTACRERSHVRKALYTKRSLSTKDNTNKKRKLFELALNKTRPHDEKSKNKENKQIKIDEEVGEDSQPPDELSSEDNTSNIPNTVGKVVKPMELNKALAKVLQMDKVKQNSEEKKINKEKPCPVETPVNSVGQPPSCSNQLKNSKKEEVVFDWGKYLCETRSYAAWVRLFKDAFPCQPNLFKVGYRLEVIDPQRPSLFCAAHVSQVKGYRIKISFDGFAQKYNFWVNADSPNIFPCGFCSSHGIELEPPWGSNKQTFNWFNYLSQIKAKPAPPKCFINKQVNSGEPNLFKVGMKIEAVDKKNSYLVCVATVSAVVDHRILVHFDSWDDSFDYWCEYYSPHIHPVHWCQRNNYMLTPPKGMKKKNFSWKKYLQDTGSEAAPDCAFMVRPSIKFKKGSKLEAVDPRAPHLLRVATVKQVLPYQVHIVFDGFPDHFGYWFEDDSPDLHPVNWGGRTGHPLTPPPKPSDKRTCVTAGCLGDGNASSGDIETHDTVDNCPYSVDNLDDDSLIPDRLSSWNQCWSNRPLSEVRKEISQMQKTKRCNSVDSVEPCIENVNCSQPHVITPSSAADIVTSPTETDPNRPSHTFSPKEDGEESSNSCDKLVSDSISSLICCSQINGQDLLRWSSSQVTKYIESIVHKATTTFYNHKVDGEGLLMLTEDDLYKRLDFNETEASLIYSNISQLRNKFTIKV